MIIAGVAVVAAGCTAMVIAISGVRDLRQRIIEEVDLATNIVADQNKFLIQFGQQAQATKNLSVFQVRPAITRACLYDAKGNVFAFYPMPESDNDTTFITSDPGFRVASRCPLMNQPLSRVKGGMYEVFQPITKEEERVGSIYVEASLDRVDAYLMDRLYTSLAVMGGVVPLALFLAVWLQRQISGPITELSEVASRVSAYKDYSYRLLEADTGKEIRHHYSPELVTLVETFNHMLIDIEAHEAELCRKHSEQQEAREAAESASLAKSHFLASISHELRTPLNAIIGFSTIINSQLFGEINEKYLEYSRDIHSSGVHLLEIINDILDLSKAEAGELELQPSTFHLQQVIEKCARILQKIADEHEVAFELDIAPDLPSIVADRVRVTQIVLNLLSNAVKFSHRGAKVIVCCFVRYSDEGEPLFYITVEDSGVGMTKAEIKTALQTFGQIDNGLDRRYEGTGLGLPLTKELVELHKGSIYIESTPGEGTIVHLILPSYQLE